MQVVIDRPEIQIGELTW